MAGGKKTSPEQSAENYMVAFPLSKEEFKEFISDLLGKSQTLTGGHNGYFEFTKNDIAHVYELINQRISQQNEADLVQFSARFVFNDDTTVLVTGIENILSYNEIRQISTESIHLTWNYLIKFQNKDHPEKQDIELSVIKGQHISLAALDDGYSIFSGSFNRHFLSSLMDGHITYNIKHTARTWGADIQALLSETIKGYIISPRKINKFIRENVSLIAIATAFLFFTGSILTSYFISEDLHSKRLMNLKDVSNNGGDDPVMINQFIAEIVASGDWERSIFMLFVFLLLMAMVSLVVRKWVVRSGTFSTPGIILFTGADLEDHKKLLKRKSRSWLRFSISIFVSIVSGIVANFVFSKFMEL